MARYGPLLLALYFVMTSRWGSVLLPGPPYIGDVVLGALIVGRIWLLVVGDEDSRPLISRALAVPTALLIGYAVLQLGLGELNVTALRDAAPYLYAVLVLFGQSYLRLSSKTVLRLVFGALIIHAGWSTAVELFPSIDTVPTLGDGDTNILTFRQDIDGAILGVLAGMALDRTLTGRTPVLSAAVGAWALYLVMLDQSRASLLALIAILSFVGLRYVALKNAGALPLEPGTGRLGRRGGWFNPGLAASVVIAVPLTMTLISAPPAAFERSVNAAIDTTLIDKPARDRDRDRDSDRGSDRGGKGNGGRGESTGGGGKGGDGKGGGGKDVKPKPPKIPQGATDNGVGTFQARTAAWKAIVSWMGDGGVTRIGFGVGFGPHYMQLSEADIAFQGDYPDPTVRAVHNYVLNTSARLGIIGALLEVAIGLLALVAALRLTARVTEAPDLDLLAGLLIIAIPVVSLLGVVLESPFGAIPYFWAVGYLSARMVEEGLWRPLPLPSWLPRAETPA